MGVHYGVQHMVTGPNDGAESTLSKFTASSTGSRGTSASCCHPGALARLRDGLKEPHRIQPRAQSLHVGRNSPTAGCAGVPGWKRTRDPGRIQARREAVMRSHRRGGQRYSRTRSCPSIQQCWDRCGFPGIIKTWRQAGESNRGLQGR